jgi:hypothetical protein
MRQVRVWLATVGVLGLAAAGCGGGDTGGHGSAQGASDKPTKQQPASPTPTAKMPPGTWKHQSGQADHVQQTLTGAGFECTRHSDKTIDLRLCSKGMKEPDRDKYSVPGVIGGSIRFYSAPDGTVLMAKIDNAGTNLAREWTTMQKQMFASVLPAEDAAIIAADGDKLTWGSYVKDPTNSDDGWLIANGYTPFVSPSGESLPLTKEQALPKLTAQKMTCEFGDPLGFDDDHKLLTCTDPSFTSKHEDGSIAGATALIEVTDSGGGISDILLEGSHASVPDDLRGVTGLAPKLAGLGTKPPLPAVQQWISGHLDGLPHSAYVGDRLVSVAVVPDSGTGDSVSADVSLEVPELGYDPSKVSGTY